MMLHTCTSQPKSLPSVNFLHLTGVFHWSRPYNRLYDSRVSLKSLGRKSRKKCTKNWGQFHLPRQDIVHPGLSGSTSRLDFRSGCFSPRLDGETIRTSHKPLADKLYQAPTSLTDKPTGLKHFPDPPRLD